MCAKARSSRGSLAPNYALKGTLRTLREFPGYDVGAGPLNAALGTTVRASGASRITGVGLALCSAALAARLVWEQTVLSWESGPQMVGFVLMHSGVGILLFAALLAGSAWTLVVLVASLVRRRLRPVDGVCAAAILACVGLVSIPYGRWVELFASRIAAGPHAVDFLVHMAALGEIGAVRALVERGVPVDKAARIGVTAVQAAENEKQAEVRKYLVEHRGGGA